MIRSHLAARAPSGFGPDDLARSQRLIAEAWRTRGLLVISADDPNLTWPERELVRTLGEKRFGKRNIRKAA